MEGYLLSTTSEISVILSSAEVGRESSSIFKSFTRRRTANNTKREEKTRNEYDFIVLLIQRQKRCPCSTGAPSLLPTFNRSALSRFRHGKFRRLVFLMSIVVVVYCTIKFLLPSLLKGKNCSCNQRLGCNITPVYRLLGTLDFDLARARRYFSRVFRYNT